MNARAPDRGLRGKVVRVGIVLVFSIAGTLILTLDFSTGDGIRARAQKGHAAGAQGAEPAKHMPAASMPSPTCLASERGRVVEVAVVDRRGNPLVGARCALLARGLYEAQPVGAAHGVTAADGVVELSTEDEGGLVLSVRMEGYQPAIVVFEGALPAAHVVTLDLGARFIGRVVSAGGKGVGGAVLRARSASVSTRWDESAAPGVDAIDQGSGKADADGYFEIKGLRHDTLYVIEAYADGFVMQKCRLSDPRNWMKPTEEPIYIGMESIRVAVLGVRHAGVEVTPIWRCFFETLARGWTKLSPGLATSHASPGMGLLSPPLSLDLRRLRDRYYVHLAMGESRDGNSLGWLTFPLLNGKTELHEVLFTPLGARGWDTPQWIDVSDAGLSMGHLELVWEGDVAEAGLDRDPLLILQVQERGTSDPPVVRRVSQFNESNSCRIDLLAGEYVLTRDSSPGDRRGLIIHANGTVRLSVSYPPPRLITIAPVYESGIEAREMGVYVRIKRPKGEFRYVFQRLEPEGCCDGPEVVVTSALVPLDDWEVYLRKHGFEPITLPLKGILPGNAIVSPVLRRTN